MAVDGAWCAPFAYYSATRYVGVFTLSKPFIGSFGAGLNTLALPSISPTQGSQAACFDN